MNPVKRYPSCPARYFNPRMFQFGYKEKKLWASSAKVRRHTNFNTNIHLVPRSGEGSKKKKMASQKLRGPFR